MQGIILFIPDRSENINWLILDYLSFQFHLIRRTHSMLLDKQKSLKFIQSHVFGLAYVSCSNGFI